MAAGRGGQLTMSDPKPGLKLPLRVTPEFPEGDFWTVVDRNGYSIRITKHRAEIIVAALTADAKPACHPGCVPVVMFGDSVLMHVEGCANAEKEARDDR